MMQALAVILLIFSLHYAKSKYFLIETANNGGNNESKDKTRDIWSNIVGISSQVIIPTVYIFKNYVGLFLYYPPR